MSPTLPPRPVLLAGALLLVVGAVTVLREGSLPGLAGADASSPTDPQTALEEGNRKFRTGRLEEALATYRSGWNPRRPDPVLAYNLGTTAHHLGRLPEAVLWYRRAAELSHQDRWLLDNLERARDHLGAPRTPPPDLVTRLAHLPGLLWGLVALTGCGALALLLSRQPKLERTADLLTAATAALLLTALLLPRLAATPAVVLEPCSELPAGSEVWVRPAPDGGFEVRADGETVPCPPGTVEPVAP